MSIYEFALKMEKDGGNYYRRISQQCEDEWLKGIFEFLALEEDKHYNIFNNMKNKVKELEFSNIGREKCLNIFQTKSKEELLKSLSQVQTDIYVSAAEDEKNSISLYEEMLEEVETEEERMQLLSIIEEEKKHLKFMEEIIELMHKLEE